MGKTILRDTVNQSRTIMNRALISARHEKAFLALIIFSLLKLFLVLITMRNPQGAALVDSREYLADSSTLINSWTYINFNWPPGYPLFIALASGWTTPGFVSTVFAQLFLTSVIAIMLVPIGTRLASKKVGLTAGWLYALSPDASLWALTVMSETLYASLLVGSIWIWLHAKDGSSNLKYVFLGILLGSGAMVRNIGLLVIPVWIIFNFLLEALRKQYRPAMSTSFAIAAGCAIILIPWGVHNSLVHGEFALTKEHSRTFYLFNVATVLAEVEGMSRDQAAVQMATAADPFGITLGLLKGHPTIFIREQVKGILRSMFGTSSGAWARAFGYPLEMQGSLNLLSDLGKGNLSKVGERLREITQIPEMVMLLGLSILAFGHTLVLYGLFSGLLFKRGGDSWTLLVLLFTVVLLAVIPGSVGQARFRIPVEPYLALLAGLGWDAFRSGIREKVQRN